MLIVDNVGPTVMFCHLWVIYKKHNNKVRDVTGNLVHKNVTCSSTFKNTLGPPPPPPGGEGLWGGVFER
jgi:hypothetical protein